MRRFIVLAMAMVPLASGCSSEPEPLPEASVEAPKAAVPIAVIKGEASGPIYTDNRGDILALSGYDAVSYFTGDGKPVKGSAQHVVLYQGFEYRFASIENAQIFAADPAKYAPAFGGHGAWAMAHGQLASSDPEIYDIVDGTLYMLYDERVQAEWNKDKARFIEQAKAQYPKFTPEQRYDDPKRLHNY